VETTGLDTKKDNIIELGAIGVDTDTWEIKAEVSELVREKDYKKLDPEIVEITGITDYMLLEQGMPLSHVYPKFGNAMQGVDCFVAHNAAFDRPMLINNLERRGLDTSPFKNVPWVCTYQDLQYPKKVTCRKLSHMAVDMGVHFDPKTLHRALDDVKLTMEMLKARGVPWDQDFEYAQTPNIKWICKPEKPWVDGGKQVAHAKKLGFRFDGEAKLWYKIVKEDEPMVTAPFRIIKDESYGKEEEG
jgi:DNA polymerase-3 subunit epsilon